MNREWNTVERECCLLWHRSLRQYFLLANFRIWHGKNNKNRKKCWFMNFQMLQSNNHYIILYINMNNNVYKVNVVITYGKEFIE